MKFLVETGTIEEDDFALYQYGLKLLIKRVFHVAVVLLLGLVAGEFYSVVSFLIAYISLREYSGGYHAKTSKGCYLCTIIVTICVLLGLRILVLQNVTAISAIMLGSGIIIWSMSPQEALNKPLDIKEFVTYQKIARKHLIIFAVAALSGFICIQITRGIVCAWLIQAVMLVLGYFQREINQSISKKRI